MEYITNMRYIFTVKGKLKKDSNGYIKFIKKVAITVDPQKYTATRVSKFKARVAELFESRGYSNVLVEEIGKIQ